jgi:hypothetical protein
VDSDKLASFYRELGLFPELVDEYGVASYMVGTTMELDAYIRLLSFQATRGQLEIQLDDIEYIYVLRVDLAQDLFSDFEVGIVTN